MLRTIRRMINPAVPTVAEAVEEFYLFKAAETSDSNSKNYRKRLLAFVDRFGDCLINELRPAHMDAWVIELRGRKWAEATMYSHLHALKSFERFCFDRYPDEMRRPFVAHIKNPNPKPNLKGKLPAAADVEAMIAAARRMLAEDDPQQIKDATIFFWILETGCRRLETALQAIGDLGLDSPEEVDGTLVYECVLTHSKTHATEQTVDYTEAMAVILRRWLAVRPSTDREGVAYDALFVRTGNCGRKRCSCPVCKDWGKPATISTIRFALRHVSEQAGLPREMSPHKLRHYLGQRVTDSANLEIARQKLRHSDIAVTAKYYAHQDNTRRKRATISTSLLSEQDAEQK